jgi:thiamine monophosphate kinase
VIDGHAVPLDNGNMGLQEALSGGEDYELLFAASPKLRRRLAGVRRLTQDLAVTKIGRMTADKSFMLELDGMQQPLPAGFEHFVP